MERERERDALFRIRTFLFFSGKLFFYLFIYHTATLEAFHFESLTLFNQLATMLSGVLFYRVENVWYFSLSSREKKGN